MLRRTFKLISPVRGVLIRLQPPNAKIDEANKRYFVGGFLELPPDNRYDHFLVSIYPSIEEADQEKAPEHAQTTSVQEYAYAKKFFTSLLQHCPMEVIHQIMTAAKVFQKHYSWDQVESKMRRVKLRSRVHSILTRNVTEGNKTLELLIDLFDRTRSEYLCYDFLKSHETFLEFSREDQSRRLKYNHCSGEMFDFDKTSSVVNSENLQFKSQVNVSLQPIKPSDNFLFEDDDVSKLAEEIDAQESHYENLIMKQESKQEEKIQPHRLARKRKDFEKIILKNTNPDPLDIEYGRKWVYIYSLPYDLNPDHVKTILDYANEFGRVVSHQAFSYKDLMDVNDRLYSCQAEQTKAIQEQQEKKNTSFAHRSIEQKLLARSSRSIDKEINLNNSYMLLEFKEQAELVNTDTRMFGVELEGLKFKVDYAEYKRSLIISGIPVGINSTQLANIINRKLIEKDLRAFCMAPEAEGKIQNWNSFALLKFNSFWETLKTMEALGGLTYDGIALKLFHAYGGLKVVEGGFEEYFEEVQIKKKKIKNEVQQALKEKMSLISPRHPKTV